MTTPKTFHHPFPDRLSRDIPYPEGILDDIGSGFFHGLVCGSAFNFLKGIYQSPSGARFMGALEGVRMKAPRLAGRWGLFNTVYSTVECAMIYGRQKDDPWNSITAGTVSGVLMCTRPGLRPMALSMVCGGVLFALFEGGVIMYDNFLGKQQLKQQLENPVQLKIVKDEAFK